MNKSNEYLNRVFTFTAPLFAGAVLVVVFSVVGTSITRPEVRRCYTLDNAAQNKISCKSKHQNMAKRAMDFTNYSQELLFLGKTKQYLPLF